MLLFYVAGASEIYRRLCVYIDELGRNIQYEGYLDSYVACTGLSSLSLQCKMAMFIDSDYKAALLVCSGYSFAMMKNNDWIFLFDSHSRDLEGWYIKMST